MSRVDGITTLQPIILVDNNHVVCQAAESPDSHTAIVLVTPADAWVKTLKITAPGVFGYSLSCGDKSGSPMSGLNSDMKFTKVDLGEISGGIAVQFLKPKTFGIYCDYGTLTIPASLNGYTIAFFWPNDASGDHWAHFMNIITQAGSAVDNVGGVAEGVVKIGKSGSDLVNMFR